MEIHSQRLVFLLGLFLTACGGLPKPKNFSESPVPLLEALDVQRNALNALSAELELDVWKDDRRVKLKQLMAVDQHGRVRLEILSSFGHPITTLTSDGARLMIYDAEQKRFFLGAASARNLERLLSIPIAPADLSALLRGTVPKWVSADSTVSWNSQRGRYELSQTMASMSQTIEMEPENFRVRRLERKTDGQLDYRIKLGDYRRSGDVDVPHRLFFESQQGAVTVDMTLIEVTVNPKILDATFTLDAPRGIVVESL